jgi:hypothetical protein
VALTGDYQLTFSFTLNTGAMREMVINSTRKLNGGEWHKIWIDYNDYHVRFMINTNVKMVDLLPEEEFGPFEVRSDVKCWGLLFILLNISGKHVHRWRTK